MRYATILCSCCLAKSGWVVGDATFQETWELVNEVHKATMLVSVAGQHVRFDGRNNYRHFVE